jgi:hypothetical protein
MLAFGVWLVRAAGSGLVAMAGVGLFIIGAVADKTGYWPIGIGLLMFAAGFLAWPRWPNAWKNDPPTERQLAYALDLGIAIPDGVTKGQLSDMISAAKSVTGR